MKILKFLAIFSFGGLSYGLCELMFRGFTHISMFVVGGLLFYLTGLLDEGKSPPCLIVQMALGCLIITSGELLSGTVINLFMDLEVWDYSLLPMNLLGQICPQFSLIWLALTLPVIYLDDLLRHFLFSQPLKRQRLLPGRKEALNLPETGSIIPSEGDYPVAEG